MSFSCLIVDVDGHLADVLQPTIIKPFFGDQAFWSERVESLNVGSAVRKLTSEHLADALKKATTDEKQIAKAKVVGAMIRKVSLHLCGLSNTVDDHVQENGVSRAIEAIYRDLVSPSLRFWDR